MEKTKTESRTSHASDVERKEKLCPDGCGEAGLTGAVQFKNDSRLAAFMVPSPFPLHLVHDSTVHWKALSAVNLKALHKH